MLKNIRKQLKFLVTFIRNSEPVQTQLPFEEKLRYERILNSYLGIFFQFQALSEMIKQFYVAGTVLSLKTFHNFVMGDNYSERRYTVC